MDPFAHEGIDDRLHQPVAVSQLDAVEGELAADPMDERMVEMGVGGDD